MKLTGAVKTPTKISTRLFAYHARTNTFTAEISELQVGTDYATIFAPLEGGGRGFVMVSARTGMEMVVRLETEHKDVECDITHWTLLPVLCMVPSMRGVKVVIFND